MRKALFALILVLAAFAGGAAVNGPGLLWLKSALLAAMRDRLKPAGPIAIANPTPIAAQSAGASQSLAPGRLDDLPAGLRPPTALDRPGPLGDPAAPAALPPTAVEAASPPPRSDAAPLDLATEPPPVDPAVTPASGSPGSSSTRDWSDLRRRLRELGVARYEIDAETNGRSRFRCVVPLAGRRAVGQQFEGEGDDDFQAAEAALRRLTLWRATELAPR